MSRMLVLFAECYEGRLIKKCETNWAWKISEGNKKMICTTVTVKYS